eukprot:TRINITY_DN33895_c0_g1_i1.p1 TRINITY_DN33895_c0_g1~~TRINITY_DN33895_c0_g1_i1.p1  ORF type:complete len:237 (+),score=35.19 TRINITY_DN33895_c0_g1_i1:92-802(+)
MASGDVCSHCGQPDATKRCSACKGACYCSVECQRKAWPDHKRTCGKPTVEPKPSVDRLPGRTGGAWDNVSDLQLKAVLSEGELSRLAAGPSSSRTSLLAALVLGAKRSVLKLFANPPRYDRLLILTVKERSTYVVEAGLDTVAGAGWWTTRSLTEPDLNKMDLTTISGDALAAEYSGVFGFLELCKTLGPPRYGIRTDLDPDAKPHVILVVERLLASSSLRILLDEDALERADADS